MSLSKLKILNIILMLFTLAYAWLTIMLTLIVYDAFLFKDLYWSFLFFIGVFGLFGLIGVLMLLFFDNFKNKLKRLLTTIFLAMGLFSALSVSILSFSDSAMKSTTSIVGFMLTWGLLIFAVLVLYYSKKKLFPKK